MIEPAVPMLAVPQVDVAPPEVVPEAEQLTRPKEVHPAPEGILTLGIETSCDETAVAVLRGERDVLASVVSSQAALHERYGGVVPEEASRAHLQAINPALAEALTIADVTFWDLDVVAVTVGPGLAGSLIVGVAAAKSLAAVLEVPLVPVNHLEALAEVPGYKEFAKSPRLSRRAGDRRDGRQG